MAGTRTAPDFTGAATDRTVSMSFIDASGDKFTLDVDGIPIAATSAQVEALAVAVQAASQASLWSIKDSFYYKGVGLASNAVTGSRDSVKDGINILYRAPSGLTVTLREPAPMPATMIGDTDAVATTNALLTAINSAFEAIASTYTAESAQYTERRERSQNPRDTF